MTVKKVTIEASKFTNAVSDTTAPALAKSDCDKLPIVEILPSGRVEIVDGYHRIAGMISAGETTIDCLICDDADLIGDAANAEDPAAQAAALELIYASPLTSR